MPLFRQGLACVQGENVEDFEKGKEGSTAYTRSAKTARRKSDHRKIDPALSRTISIRVQTSMPMANITESPSRAIIVTASRSWVSFIRDSMWKCVDECMARLQKA